MAGVAAATRSMSLARLLHPRSVAVVGASERPESYGGETLLNLNRMGYPGEVWGVNPRRRRAHGFPCVPSLADLPEPVDAVVVAVPAASVPEVIDQAGALGCGGAVVYAAGFREGGGADLEAALVAAARRHSLPVCGPNCDGLVSLHDRAALWGDALAAPEPGHVALVSQSGNLAVNALGTRRGLRLHTAISSGNEAVLATADYVEHLAGEDGVRSIALLVEADGDGARLCEALAGCAEAGIGVAVLKVGASAAGAAAATAHTGALAGDHRVFRALVEEAGGAWAADVHDLLELAKAMAARGPKPRRGGGLVILTCSGGDSGLGADEAARLRIELPPLAPATVAALRDRLPDAATVANPLDYTAMIWGEADALRDIVRLTGEDPGVGQVLVFYDRPLGIDGYQAFSWDAVQRGILAGARESPVGTIVAATLPELLDDASAWAFGCEGVPAVAGLRTGVACAAALATAPADPARLRAIAKGSDPSAHISAQTEMWLAEHVAKARLRAAGVPVVEGRLVADEDDAVAALRELGGPVALKRSERGLLHKAAAGALALDLATEEEVRAAYRRIGGPALVERMAAPGVELLVSVTRAAVVPALVVGLGGAHAEVLDDVAVLPLPVTPERVERALRGLRGAPLLAGADLGAAAELATTLPQDLALIECNPVIVGAHGAVVVDAVARSAKETAA